MRSFLLEHSSIYMYITVRDLFEKWVCYEQHDICANLTYAESQLNELFKIETTRNYVHKTDNISMVANYYNLFKSCYF